MVTRLASQNGRAQLVHGDRLLDLERASGGRFPADPMAALGAWDALREWSAGLAPARFEELTDPAHLGPPVPRPARGLRFGLNNGATAGEPVAGSRRPRLLLRR